MKRSLNIILFLLIITLAGKDLIFIGEVFSQKLRRPDRMVTAVEVKNNKAVSTATILTKVKTQVGKPFSQVVLNQDLKRLYETGFFTDVSIDVQDYKEGVKVIFVVTEKPMVEEIQFKGNKVIRSEKLIEQVKTKKDEMFSYRQLKEDAEAIRSFYEKKGFSLAKVDYKVDVDEKTNRTVVVFDIVEAAKIRIKRIFVEGNRSFSDRRLLKLMSTRKDTLFTSGYFKKETFQEDIEKIKAFYQGQGYMDVEVDSDLKYDHTGRRLYITLKIDEGKKYLVGQIQMRGNQVYPEQQIRESLEMLPGVAFSHQGLRNDIIKIQEFYFHRGYISAVVDADTLLNTKTGNIDITYSIVENQLTYVERIDIRGNTKTKDVVIRRELKIYPGERFDGEKLKRSKERLYNLGFFEEVTYDIEPGTAPDRKRLVVTVREAKTGEFSFGAGFSSVDKFVGFIDIAQRNFDLTDWPTFTGDGQQLRLRGEFGTIRENYLLSFTEPWIFDYPLLFVFDAYQKTHKRETDIGYGYDEMRRGGDIRLGKELGEYNRADLTYRLEDVEISDVATEASADLRAEEGTNRISSAELRFAHETRDSVFNPTKGNLTVGTAELAGGFLSGDKDFMKYTLGTTFYFTHWKKLVLESKLMAGIVDDFGDSTSVPIYERFFAGGAHTIRGYRERRVGPRDLLSKDPIGGKSMLIGNLEYTFPIFQALKLAVFYDVGNVWEKVDDFGSGDFKSGVGVGVRIKTPMGPVKLDYGYPLDADPDEEEKGRFYFSMSRGF